MSLAIGVLLLLFFALSTISFVVTRGFETDLTRLGGVDDPRVDSVLEMEIRLTAIGRSFYAYAVAGDVAERENARRAATGFESAVSNFIGLGTTAEEKRLGKEVFGLFGKTKTLGAEIIAVIEKQRIESASVRARIRDIHAVVKEKVELYLTRRKTVIADNAVANTGVAALGMNSAIDQNAAALEAYLASREPGARDRLGTAVATFERFAARFRAAGSSAEEQAWLLKISDEFSAITAASIGVMNLADRRSDLLTRWDVQRVRIEAVLRGKIVPLIRDQKARGQRTIDFHSFTSFLYLLLVATYLVSIGAALLLTRGIVRPLRKLKAAADATRRGEFEHRIDIDSNDEIGDLANSINRMIDSRKRSEEALREMAHHDALTELPNRILFQSRLVEALDNAQRTDRMVAVHFLDLDHFKDINDTLGHLTGDKLLQQVAMRLKNCARKSDTVARLGGDEFAIIQTNLLYDNGITVLAKRVIDSVAMPFDLDGERVYTGTSIGITVYPHDDPMPEKLLRNADLALYRAKQEGRGKYVLYDHEMNAEIHTRKALEWDLHEALEKEQFFLNYQPQIDLASGRVVGAEALLRWRHPVRDMVSPGVFIPVAEQAGIITELTEFVLSSTCRQAKAWQRAGLPPIRVSVNLSPADFRRKDLVPMISEMLQSCELEAEYLELEITEGMVMTDVEAVIATMHKLGELGVELAIDDFGTGFSSMNYLKRFPVQRLKIDQSFVRDILTNKEDAGISEAIIKIGHSLGLMVIAEGVESEGALEFLRDRGCEEAQGYFFSRPLAVEDFAEYLAKNAEGAAVPATEIA